MSDSINEHNWKLYEASTNQYNMLIKRQGEEADKLDKWIMTMAAGSFGLSFAFIDKIVHVDEAAHFQFLIASWSCFLAILVIGVIGFILSSLLHSVLAEEESKMLAIKYEGGTPEYKNRSIFFDVNNVLGYVQILLFIGGSLCLILFVAKNLL
jgi:hypothetical protein